jgi:hypothetical protein
MSFGSVNRAADGWRTSTAARLRTDTGWQWDLFKELFQRVRESGVENLSATPDSALQGGALLPLTKPESWQLATNFYVAETWKQLRSKSPMWYVPRLEIPDAPPAGNQPGQITHRISENPALFVAVDHLTRFVASTAEAWVKANTARFRSSLITNILIAQGFAWLVTATFAWRELHED